jgi:hypothetical protein
MCKDTSTLEQLVTLGDLMQQARDAKLTIDFRYADYAVVISAPCYSWDADELEYVKDSTVLVQSRKMTTYDALTLALATLPEFYKCHLQSNPNDWEFKSDHNCGVPAERSVGCGFVMQEGI